MPILRLSVGVTWLLFWLYWLLAARNAKSGARGSNGMRGMLLVAVLLMVQLVRVRSVSIHSPVVGAVGAVIFACGLGLAIWARVHLGRNWGMPMSQKDEPELVTTGPYRLVRHPIYTGLLLGLLGSALTVSLIGLVVVLLAGVYFYHAATVEEKNLSAAMPDAYPAYQARTKRLIPFVV